MALAFALFLNDSVFLLFANEGILSADGRRRWRIALGSSNFQLRGKQLFFTHLLLIHRPIFKLTWSLEKNTTATTTNWQDQRQVFNALRPIVVGIGFMQFIALPFVLFFYLTNVSIITVLILLYGLITAALIIVGLKRQPFALSKKRLTVLCFECLICPPIAVNLVRKLSLGLNLTDDLVSTAKALLATDQWQAAQLEFIHRIDIQLTSEEDLSLRHAALKARRDEIQTMRFKR